MPTSNLQARKQAALSDFQDERLADLDAMERDMGIDHSFDAHPLPGEAQEAALSDQAKTDRSLPFPSKPGDVRLPTPTLQKEPTRRHMLEGKMSEFGDNASLVGGEEDISHEQLQMIKARTMFQMTEGTSLAHTGAQIAFSWKFLHLVSQLLATFP